MRLITLQYCIRFVIHQHESATGVHMFPILNPPPRTIPLGHPSAPAPSILYHASNLDCISVLNAAVCTYQSETPSLSLPSILTPPW